MKVLLIDDDSDIRAFLQAHLPAHGFVVEAAETGAKGIAAARINEHDLLILDLNLPDMTGERVIAAVREGRRTTPILMFTVVGDVGSKVRLLNSGADDYLVKPFAFDELVARMRALLRRPSALVPQKMMVDDLILDLTQQSARRAGHEIALTRKEFALLECLMRSPGTVVSKSTFIEHAWDSSADPFSDSFDTHLANLRKKLGKPELIHTVHGRGYRIAA